MVLEKTGLDPGQKVNTKGLITRNLNQVKESLQGRNLSLGINQNQETEEGETANPTLHQEKEDLQGGDTVDLPQILHIVETQL